MKRVIADLFVRTHGENSLTRRLKRPAVYVAVGDSSRVPFVEIGVDRSQVRGEFLADRLCDR